jgi:hypothetical protein
MKAKIYQPTRNAMQSGDAHANHWKLEFEQEAPLYIEPLMGWTGMTDTTQQLSLWFDTQEEAVAYAKKNNIEVVVAKPKKEKVIKPKSYSANFAYNKVS